jgi:hypothetical protein
MHDWTLLSVLFDWRARRVTLSFVVHQAGTVSVVADGVSDLHIPQLNEWGPSVSVNRVGLPVSVVDGRRVLEIEMQSGNCIKICASDFEFPPGTIIENTVSNWRDSTEGDPGPMQ